MPENEKQYQLKKAVKNSNASLSSGNSTVEIDDVTMRYKSMPKRDHQKSLK